MAIRWMWWKARVEIDPTRQFGCVGCSAFMTELFSEFGYEPIAAAKIAQVHEATTKAGRHVAVEVQRPGLEPMISRDIAMLRYLATKGERLDPRLRPLEP